MHTYRRIIQLSDSLTDSLADGLTDSLTSELRRTHTLVGVDQVPAGAVVLARGRQTLVVLLLTVQAVVTWAGPSTGSQNDLQLGGVLADGPMCLQYIRPTTGWQLCFQAGPACYSVTATS